VVFGNSAKMKAPTEQKMNEEFGRRKGAMINKFTINGKSFTSMSGSVSVINGRVFIDGKEVSGEEGQVSGVVEIRVLEGQIQNLRSDASITVEGDVQGNVDAGVSASVGGSVGGQVEAGGSAKVGGSVGGSVAAGGSVNCGDVAGNVDAGGSVKRR